MTTHFVPTDELRRLTKNSYEHLAAQLDSAVLESKAVLFPENTPNKIERLGTFTDHVIVASDDGRFLKVMYENASDGIKLGAAEPVPVPVYTDDNLDTYLAQEAGIAVEQLFAGLSNEALGQIRTFFPFIPDHKDFIAERSLEAAVDSIHADRPWKRLYRERHEAIADGVETKDITSFAQFGDLSTAENPENSRVQVRESLDKIVTRLFEHLQLLDSVGDLRKLNDQAQKKDDADVLMTFTAFVEDLKQDLRSIYDLVVEAVQAVKSVVSLGKLNDALASELKDYEVASRFVSKMAETLRSS